MKEIYIGFSYKKGFAPISKLIRYILKTNFSHTYFKFKQENLDEFTIFHAVGNGLEYISESNFKNINYITKEFKLEINDSVYKHILNLCHTHATKKHGFFQNLGILFVKLLKKININYRNNPFNDGINCSEWNTIILNSIYSNWSKKHPNLITPLDIYNFLNTKC